MGPREGGQPNEIVSSRRPSACFIAVAQPKKNGKQLELGTEWTDDRLRANDYMNEVRATVGGWSRRDYPGVTCTTRHLLECWQRIDMPRTPMRTAGRMARFPPAARSGGAVRGSR